MPSDAKIAAAASGIPASSAAITRSCRTLTIMWNCAANDTTAAAAASPPSAIIAFRSHRTARSGPAGSSPARPGRRRNGQRGPREMKLIVRPLPVTVADVTSRPSTPGGRPKSCQAGPDDRAGSPYWSAGMPNGSQSLSVAIRRPS
jgi:hypothetical protein